MGASLLVNIDVDDLAKAEAFYVKAFGLKPTRRFGDGGVELMGGGAPIYLLVKAAGSRALKLGQQTRTYARHWTPVHLDFVVTDIKAAVVHAQAAGATLEGEMETHNWGYIAHMADPFGHGICLVEFRNRGYDEVSTPA
ncbi:VOC family protein [Desertibaculum subflavum]|uniref:VOC family protein n=1 Tax=Desertibaculum subflavum TaxID=2268458 RepID=UPI000E660794